MTGCPCKDCTDRQCGCHAKCEKYKDWRKEYDDQKETFMKSKKLEADFYDYNVQRKRRILQNKFHSKNF